MPITYYSIYSLISICNALSNMARRFKKYKYILTTYRLHSIIITIIITNYHLSHAYFVTDTMLNVL